MLRKRTGVILSSWPSELCRHHIILQPVADSRRSPDLVFSCCYWVFVILGRLLGSTDAVYDCCRGHVGHFWYLDWVSQISFEIISERVRRSQLSPRLCTNRKLCCWQRRHCNDFPLLRRSWLCMARPNRCVLRRDTPIQNSSERISYRLCSDGDLLGIQSVCQSNWPGAFAREILSYIYIAILVVECFCVWFLFVETKGPTLEEIAALFDGNDSDAAQDTDMESSNKKDQDLNHMGWNHHRLIILWKYLVFEGWIEYRWQTSPVLREEAW